MLYGFGASALSLISALIVSVISLIGVIALSVNRDFLARSIQLLVGLAAGTLIGDSFIHLIPEAYELIGDEALFGISVTAGLLVFFILEKFLRWHHAHHSTEEEHTGHEQYETGAHTPNAHIAPLVIVADGFHNFLDGAIIAASFLVSPAIGIATTIAITLHEIPQEIADFALLLHTGYSRTKALLFNFLSGLTALIGAGTVLVLGSVLEHAIPILVASTAGAFIYIAVADIVPELHKTKSVRRSFMQFAALIVGILLMLLLTLVEA